MRAASAREFVARCPVTTRGAFVTGAAINDIYGARQRDTLYSDGAQEFRAAARDLLLLTHAASGPGRHKTSTLVAPAAQSLSVCARTLPEQAGLEHARWP